MIKITDISGERAAFFLRIELIHYSSADITMREYQKIFWVSGFSFVVKRSEREADYSPPYSAEFKNAWSYTSTLPYVCMVCCLVNHQG
jgi:hypothetical protein